MITCEIQSDASLGEQLWTVAGLLTLSGVDEVVFPPWEYQPFFAIEATKFTANTADLVVIDQNKPSLEILQKAEPVVSSALQPSQLSASVIRREFSSVTTVQNKTSVHLSKRGFQPGFYQKAIAAVLRKHPGTKFVVVSADPEWAEAVFEPYILSIEIVRSRPGDQWSLFVMTECDQHIIGGDDLGWWAAYLSGGDVYYPKSKWTDIAPKEWTPIG